MYGIATLKTENKSKRTAHKILNAFLKIKFFLFIIKRHLYNYKSIFTNKKIIKEINPLLLYFVSFQLNTISVNSVINHINFTYMQYTKKEAFTPLYLKYLFNF